MKKTMTKIVFIMLSLVFVLSTCMTVFAVTTKSVTKNQNGLDMTLKFNKQEYNANEKIEVTFNVKNNNSYTVENIQTELIVPSTIKIASGNLISEAFSLNAGESKIQEIALEKVIAINDNGSTTNNLPTGNEATINNPPTGNNIVVYIIMMVISASALMFITTKKKWINKKGVMTLVLCFALVGTTTLTSVVNAETTMMEALVEETIKYDGEDVVIKGKITYNYEAYSKLQIDGVDKGKYKEGETVTITAEGAPEGQYFTGWTVVKGNITLADSKSSTTTFVMGNEDVEIKANYEVNTYTVKVISGDYGKVSPSGNVSVAYGDSKTFKITADSGYGIKDVIVDGKSVGPLSSYTLENVKENHTISVVFDTALTVTDDSSFRNAVAHGGIIILANDITISDNGDVEISKDIILHGGDYKIVCPYYSGEHWRHLVNIEVIESAYVKIASGHFVSNIDQGTICISVMDNATLDFYGGSIIAINRDSKSSKLNIYDGFFDEVRSNFGNSSNAKIYGGIFR